MSKQIVVSDADYKRIKRIQKKKAKDTIKETIGYLIDREEISEL